MDGTDRNTELGLSPYHDQCLKMYDESYAGFWLQANGTILNDPAGVGEFTPCDPPLNASLLVQDQCVSALSHERRREVLT